MNIQIPSHDEIQATFKSGEADVERQKLQTGMIY
jgi:hypothetical protein